MSYQHEHIPFVEPIDWYNQVADVYKTYHRKLNTRDVWAVKKYLPRSLQWVHVLDLGGGDGRRAILLQWMWIPSRTIVDISQSMLDHAPSRTQKVCADIREPFPLEWGTHELILMTFVLLHLDAISGVLAEARRCIAPTWRMLIVHHHERRPFVHHISTGNLKIKTRHWRYEDLEAELKATWWEVDIFPVDEATKIFCCFPV